MFFIVSALRLILDMIVSFRQEVIAMQWLKCTFHFAVAGFLKAALLLAVMIMKYT